MIEHYIKSAFRNLKRQKLFTIINVVGLSIGLAASFVILLFVIHELTFDRNHSKHRRIYKILAIEDMGGENKEKIGVTSFALCGAIKENFPEIDGCCSFQSIYGSGYFIKKDGHYLREDKQISLVDKEAFNIFDIPLIHGDSKTVFNEKASCVISESIANKYFPGIHPIGELITIKSSFDESTMVVTGVMKDCPTNSTISAHILCNMELFKEEKEMNNWRSMGASTYVLLNSEKHRDQFTQKLLEYARTQHPDMDREYDLQKLTDTYLGSAELKYSNSKQGDISKIYMFSSIAFLILLISSINYIITSTAYAESRTREVGIRKVVGAEKKMLVRQFLSESIVLTLLCLPTALVLIEIFIPKINELFDRNLSINYTENWIFILGIVSITVVTGFISGSYVSFYISRLNPISVLRSKFIFGKNKAIVRKLLITFQMVIFIGLICSTIIIYQQIHYVNNKDLGYDTDNLININSTSDYVLDHFTTFKNELLSNPNITAVSSSYSGINSDQALVNNLFLDAENDKGKGCFLFYIDADYMNALGIKMEEGREFIKNSYSDSLAIILNMTAVKHLDLVDPIGKWLYLDSQKYTIIGISKDFSIGSLKHKTQPVAFLIKTADLNASQIVIRTNNTENNSTLSFIENIWDKYSGGEPLDYNYFEQINREHYDGIRNFASTIGAFAGISILIAILGLFGLSMFIAKKRTKEIGIRKVFGARNSDVLNLIIKEFTILNVIANIIAWPLTWYLMDKWLQDFAHQINISFWVFIGTAIVSLIIVLSVMCINALKAANANPVDSLRYE